MQLNFEPLTINFIIDFNCYYYYYYTYFINFKFNVNFICLKLVNYCYKNYFLIIIKKYLIQYYHYLATAN